MITIKDVLQLIFFVQKFPNLLHLTTRSHMFQLFPFWLGLIDLQYKCCDEVDWNDGIV